MSWKTEIQLIDLDSQERLEVSCKVCNCSRYENVYLLSSKMDMAFDYLDEVERKLSCNSRGCSGEVRIARASQGDTEGFVGGLA